MRWYYDGPRVSADRIDLRFFTGLSLEQQQMQPLRVVLQNCQCPSLFVIEKQWKRNSLRQLNLDLKVCLCR